MPNVLGAQEHIHSCYPIHIRIQSGMQALTYPVDATSAGTSEMGGD